MNTITRNIGAVLAATLLAIPSAKAIDLCWENDVGTDWQVAGNWTDCNNHPGRVPLSTDNVTIKSTAQLECHVEGTATCNVLKVEAGAPDLEIGTKHATSTLEVVDHIEVYGLVRILQSSILKLGGTTTSTVDGEVVFWLDTIPVAESDPCDADPFGTLLISANMTITGNGGLIYGRKCTAINAPTRGIIKTGPGVRLTLKTTPLGSPLVVVGFIDIRALLTNESAHVGSNQVADQLLLSTNDKSGNSGKWFCYDGDFRIKNLVQVSGSNDWDMTLAVPGAHLWFEAGSVATCLSGDFNVHDGVVDVDTDLCTSGSATVVSDGVSRPKIFIRYGSDGSFGGLCSALCGP